MATTSEVRRVIRGEEGLGLESGLEWECGSDGVGEGSGANAGGEEGVAEGGVVAGV